MQRHHSPTAQDNGSGGRRPRARGILAAVASGTTALAGLAVATSGAATAAACDGVWRPTSGVAPAGAKTRAILPLSATDVVTAGEDATSAVLSRWNGGRLTTVRPTDLEFVTEVRGTRWSDLYVLGSATDFTDQILHFDGRRFTPLPGLTEALGAYGYINTMEVSGGSVYAFGGRFTTTGSITQVLRWDGHAWNQMRNNLADSAYAVPLASATSPTGEVYVAGEDVTSTVEYPIWRSPWIGKVVGDRVQRMATPAPGGRSTVPGAMTFDAQGRLVVGGTTGADWVTGLWPYAATRQPDGRWSLWKIPSTVAQLSDVHDLATVGSSLHAASWGMINRRNVADLSAVRGGAFTNPLLPDATANEAPWALAGLPTGQGWLATLTAADTGRIWSVCGAPTGREAPADASPAPETVTPARTSAPAPAPASLPDPATRARVAREARERHTAMSLDGLADPTRTAATAAATPVSGPLIEKLRSAARLSSTTVFAARDACGAARPGQYRCFAKVVTTLTSSGYRDPVTGVPVGYGPDQFRAAYGLPASGGKGRMVAVVIPFHHPNLAGDLATYRTAASLPACTKANGCLRIVGQDGGKPPTTIDDGWAIEATLDVTAVSAACPDCRILVVEADGAGDGFLAEANQTAARLGAYAVSNSFGRDEDPDDVAFAADFVPTTVPLVAATGDWGHGAIFPATVARVVGVGGTRLLEAPGQPRGWTESVWGDSGGGCSAVQTRPAWQKASPCFRGMTSAASLAADADPATGAGIYWTPSDPSTQAGWYLVGGTSLSAPLVAGMSAVSGHRLDERDIWSGGLRAIDVRTGGAIGWCAPTWECTAVPGYDGATGFGVPRW